MGGWAGNVSTGGAHCCCSNRDYKEVNEWTSNPIPMPVRGPQRTLRASGGRGVPTPEALESWFVPPYTTYMITDNYITILIGNIIFLATDILAHVRVV